MDFLNKLMDFIEDELFLDVPVLPGKLEEESQAIAIRPTPAGVDSRYLDKDKTHEFSFQVLSKDPNHMKALKVLYDITGLLDGLSNGAIKSADGSFSFVKCEAYVFPNYVETTEHGETIYTALFTAELGGGI